MSWPAALFWAMIVSAMLSDGPALLYLLPISGAFLSLQMLPDFIGGANLLPPTVCAAALVAKVASQRGNLARGLEAALDPARVGLFTAFIVYAASTAFLLPRIFAGLILVIPASASNDADLYGGRLLAPGFGNFSQTAYLVISYLTVVAFSVIGARSDVRQHYMQALIWGAFAVISTGVVDLLFFHAGLSELLHPFRTAQYTLLTDVAEGGTKRVVGLAPEASSYGTLCVATASALLFLRPLYPAGGWRLAATAACFATVEMALLSTSSTAIVGLGVLAGLFVTDLVYRSLSNSGPGRNRVRREFRAVALIVLGAIVLGASMPEQVAKISELLNESLINKTYTDSYYTRSLWTHVGWRAFLDTGGLGAGVGSLRTSNWAVNILGSTGVFGALLLFGFLAQKLGTTKRRRPAEDAAFAHALKLALIPPLAMSLVSATTTEIGIGMAAILGLLSSHDAWSGEQESAVRPSPRGGRFALLGRSAPTDPDSDSGRPPWAPRALRRGPYDLQSVRRADEGTVFSRRKEAP